MKMIIIVSDELYVSPETVVVANGSTLEICPADDFLYSVDCGNAITAESAAQNLREHIASLSSLHIEKQIVITGE